jgi:hypothetical protein
MWKRDDLRPYRMIQKKLRSEFEIFKEGTIRKKMTHPTSLAAEPVGSFIGWVLFRPLLERDPFHLSTEISAQITSLGGAGCLRYLLAWVGR